MNENEPKATGAASAELLGRMLDCHGAALRLYAGQWCNSPDDAVQEALIELARQPEMPRTVLPWLYRVVRNKAVSAARSAGRRQRREAAAAGHRTDWFLPSATDEPGPALAAAALEQLPSAEREVVVAHLWGGLTFQEIGQVLGVSDSTAHRRYLAALKGLRERLKSPCLQNP